jgi:hypothetical protein
MLLLKPPFANIFPLVVIAEQTTLYKYRTYAFYSKLTKNNIFVKNVIL